MQRSTSRSTIGATLLAVAVAGLLSGCSELPWTVTDAGASPSVSLPATSPSASPPAEIISVVNELATGSAVHQLTAGNIGIAVTYWSDLSMDEWTAGANKPLSFSMSATLTGDGGQAVYLSQVTLLAAVNGPEGALAAPAAVTDRSSVNPGYLVKAPYSYSQTFILPAIDETATSVTLSVNYELLLQTTPTSTEYAKQTASDTLTVAIAES